MPKLFSTRCRIWMIRMHPQADAWSATCRTHGLLGSGTEAYADWLVTIHSGNHPA